MRSALLFFSVSLFLSQEGWVIVLTRSVRTDPFARKEWYDIKAPAMFTNRNVGKTVVNRTQGQSMFVPLEASPAPC
jgi:hypothetical protein